MVLILGRFTDERKAILAALRYELRLRIRTGLHRVRGETTKAVERSHVPVKDRVRPMRGLQSLATGQRLLEGIGFAHALRRGDIRGGTAVGPSQRCRRPHERVREVAAAFTRLARRLANPA